MYDYKKTTWVNPNIDYLFNEDIVEYDISDAGFNIIKQFNLLPANEIKELSMIPKGIKRHIAVGLKQKENKAFSKALLDKFAEVRKTFIDVNNITDNDIITVKKDALFITKQPRKTEFGLIQFKPKNRYTSYIAFPTIDKDFEIFYNSMDNIMDIKGMSEVSINKHRLYTIETLKKFINLLEEHDSSIKRKYRMFIDKYKWNQIDDEYYLEFNNKSFEINKLFNYQNLWIPLLFIIRKELS